MAVPLQSAYIVPSDNFPLGYSWRNPREILIIEISQSVQEKIERNYCVPGCGGIEIYLNKELPHVNEFYGVTKIDSFGVWVKDCDLGVNEEFHFRVYLIPWHVIDSIIFHQAT